MVKRTIIKNGKKFIVNTPSWDTDVGFEGSVGAGIATGVAWMFSDKWYGVYTSGSAPGAQVFVSQSALAYSDNAVGQQLLTCDDGNRYFVYLKGTAGSVTFNVSQSAFSGSSFGKPDLLLQNVTDGNYYMVTLHNNAGTIQAQVNQSYFSSSQVHSFY